MGSDLEQKKARFYSAAGPLFERYGYRKTTVEEVCLAAGMSKRTFYELFRDKADLFMAFTGDWMNRTAEQWESTLPEGLDPLQRLEALIDIYARMIREHPSIQVILEEPELMKLFSQKLDEIRFVQVGGTLHTILKDGVEQGRFRPVDTKLAVWLIFSLLDTVYLLFPLLMGAPGAASDTALAEETKQFILSGLGVSPNADRRQ